MAIYMAQRLAAGMAVPEMVMAQPSKSQQEGRSRFFMHFAKTTILRTSAIKTAAPPRVRWSRPATATSMGRHLLADLISMERSSKCLRLVFCRQLQHFVQVPSAMVATLLSRG